MTKIIDKKKLINVNIRLIPIVIYVGFIINDVITPTIISDETVILFIIIGIILAKLVKISPVMTLGLAILLYLTSFLSQLFQLDRMVEKAASYCLVYLILFSFQVILRKPNIEKSNSGQKS